MNGKLRASLYGKKDPDAVRRLAAILPAYSRLMDVDEVATLRAHPCEVVDPAIVVLKS